MNIYLKSLRLQNFKGIRQLLVPFSQITNIYGANEAGKTTLMDAFLWLFFGKDSTGRKEFEIKTIDKATGNYIQRQDYEVEGVIEVDGVEHTIRRKLNEKWTKKRGSTKEEFTGHETFFYWNDVPMKKEDFESKIASIINEDIFKLLTNTTYFNSLKWQERRAQLLKIAGDISNEYVLDFLKAHEDVKYQPLLKALKEGKSIEEFKRQIAAQKTKIKNQLELMPSKIEEANRAVPEAKDYDEIDRLIAQVTADKENIESMLSDKVTAANARQSELGDLLQKKQNLSRMVLDIEFGVQNQVQSKRKERELELNEQKNNLAQLNSELLNANSDLSRAKTRRDELVKEQDTLRTSWNKIDAEKLVFNEAEFCCPTCKRAYETADVDAKKKELTENFNKDKSDRLAKITQRGKDMSVAVSDVDIKIQNLSALIDQLTQKMSVVKERIANLHTLHTNKIAEEATEIVTALDTHEQYQKTKTEFKALGIQIQEFQTATGDDNSDLLLRKKELEKQLDDLKSQLSTKGMRESQLARVAELENQESVMAQELATAEGTEYTLDQFEKAKMDTLEERVNGRFKIVRFKMFEDQINGGMQPACTTLVKEIPYSDANTAGKIQAGLDIINTLSDHYGITAPVWVDNRESVTNLPETESQLINLIVSESHPKLMIQQVESKLATA